VKFINPKRPGKAFRCDNRPPQIEWWISRARKRDPVISDISKFSVSWWSWWIGLQPSWRNIEPSVGTLGDSHRVVTGDWSCLDKPGLNGFLSVVTSLHWWGKAVSGTDGVVEWLRAVKDVHWVMSCMLSTPWYVASSFFAAC